MKNLFIYSIGVLLTGVMMTACSPESFDGADPNGIPSVSDVDFSINVDQETNQMIATYTPQAGTYPVWILNGTSYSTLQEVGYQNPEAGTYTIDLKLGNRNGFSQGVVSKTFTFNETKIDYSADFRRLCDKEWRIANKEVAHMGCGPAGTAGTEWWSAQPNDKKDFGVYDDRITFTATTRKGGSYTYDAGADGMTYVNYGTSFNTEGAGADLDVALGNQTSTWSFEIYEWQDADGNTTKQTYIQLGANTLFPYMSSDAQYADPKFRIESLTATKLVLVYETPDRSIAWRFILTSAPDERLVEEQGFDANSDFNMWKGIDPTMSFYYNPDPGWGNEQTATFESLFKKGNNDYTVTVPQACYDRWQAQVHFHTDLNISAANHYDFSAIFNSDVDINGVTVKLTNEADNDAIIDVDNIDLKAGQDVVFWKSDIEGKDLSQVKLVLDFGRAAGPTVINVSNIVLKDHANDDGPIVSGGGEGGDKPTMDWSYESGANLWKAVDDGTLFGAFGYWFADDGWGELPNQPTATHSGDAYEITLPDGIGGSQWQGQFHIDTKLTASAAKAYNFYFVMEADNDCPGVTVKLTDSGDSNFFCEGRHDVKADEPFIFKLEGATLKEGKDADAIRLFFDFGGSPAGTHVKISKIYFEEAVVLNYDDADNLWKGVDDGTVGSTFGYWFANESWGEIAHPECKHSGNTYELTMPAELGSQQWQGQFHIDTELTAKANKQYHFQVVLEADNDCPGVTIKLTDSGDSNFFCEGRHEIKADEPFVYTLKNATLKDGTDASAIRLFFDFGGTPAGTNVKISKIIFKEAE